MPTAAGAVAHAPAGGLARALALLATCGASLGLFLQALHGTWAADFFKSNALSPENRRRLVITLAAGVLAGAALGAAMRIWRGLPAARRLSHALAPLVVLAPVPALLRREVWSTPLQAALMIALVVLLFERLVRLSLEATQDLRPPAALARLAASVPRLPVPRWLAGRLPPSLVACGIGAYAAYMATFVLFMHGRFETYGYDLGQYDNIFLNTLHGRPLRCTPLDLTENWSELRNHAELSVFAFLPFYALRPRADTLLVLQAVVLALGAAPVYRFAARRLSRPVACTLALAYLLYAPMHGFQFYDFHFQPIASTFVLFTIDFVDEGRALPAVLAFVVALGCREDISIGLAFFGAFLVLSGHRRAAGLAIAITATAYFVVIRFVVMPRFGTWFFEGIYGTLMPPGSQSFAGIIATLLTNPAFVFKTLVSADKLRYALQILLPLALLPVRRPALVVSVIPGGLLTLLTTDYQPTLDAGFQYSAHFIPYIFPATVLALAAHDGTGPGRHRRRAALAAVVAGTALTTALWGAIPPRAGVRGGFVDVAMTPPTAEHRRQLRDLLALDAMVPRDAVIAVSEQEMPHLSRLNVKSLRETSNADYLLYGIASGSFGASRAAQAVAAGDFAEMATRPGYVLLRRKPKRDAPAPPPPPPLPPLLPAPPAPAPPGAVPPAGLAR